MWDSARISQLGAQPALAESHVLTGHGGDAARASEGKLLLREGIFT